MDFPSLQPLIEQALAERASLIDPRGRAAFRLFNGFTEGFPGLSIDLYASTLLLHDYSETPAASDPLIRQVAGYLQGHPMFLGNIQAILVKHRNGYTHDEKRGRLLFGGPPDDRILENEVWYALDLTMNRDASFYLDTRLLRHWLKRHSHGKRVFNAFAYTGSLGLAALAGGAVQVLQLDLSRRFLNLAKTSCSLNNFPIRKQDFMAADFFSGVARLKRLGQRFDLVLLDPPFFSTTSKGRVDQVHESTRLINKVRPLLEDGGLLVAINNALFVSGGAYTQILETLCSDGYLRLLERIPVPEDLAGYPSTRVTPPITDPAPFNHSTKIAVLEANRKN